MTDGSVPCTSGRRRTPAPFSGTATTYFVSLHRNKKSIEIDFERPAGRELFFRVMEKADVVLENYRVGTLEKLGIAYEQARARHPGIIYCSVSGFGQDGPYRDRAALDLIVQAESGMISVTGEADGRGVRCGHGHRLQGAEVGGLTMLILHPQYTGRPSRIRMLQELVDEMRDAGGVWFTHGVELARYALSDAAGSGTDGRPRPDTAPASTS